jgi:hypothetical protein
VKDLVHDTFIRAYERAGTYQSAEELGPVREGKRTRRWLGSIATRLFLDLREARIRDRAARSMEWYDLVGEQYRRGRVAAEVEAGADPESEGRRALARRALAALEERDRYIVLLSLDWYDRTRKLPFRVPSDVVDGICEKYQITIAYYRQIRYRAMKQLTLCLTAAA